MISSFPCVLALLLGAGEKAAPSEKYPRADLLLEPRELATPETAARYRILDTRPLGDFVLAHIPHSLPVNFRQWHQDFTHKPERETWEKRLGSLKIDLNTPVVVLGNDLRETARVWWILKYWGVKDVRLLNGGWTGWKAAGGKVSGQEDFSGRPGKKIQLAPAVDRLMTREQLLDALKKKTTQIADARSEGEYCGKVKLARRGGAIPRARHLEWSELIDPKTQRFKSPKELARLFKETGIDLKQPTVTYCQSGGRAAVLAFGLELMGARKVRNYYRSWAEWGNAEDTPVEQPPEKK